VDYSQLWATFSLARKSVSEYITTHSGHVRPESSPLLDLIDPTSRVMTFLSKKAGLEQSQYVEKWVNGETVVEVYYAA